MVDWPPIEEYTMTQNYWHKIDGIPIIDVPVAGVMLAGYQNGDVDWRVFLADDRNPDLSLKEHNFIISMRDFAAARGQLIELPPELQAR
jgi:hypothetical protein